MELEWRWPVSKGYALKSGIGLGMPWSGTTVAVIVPKKHMSTPNSPRRGFPPYHAKRARYPRQQLAVHRNAHSSLLEMVVES